MALFRNMNQIVDENGVSILGSCVQPRSFSNGEEEEVLLETVVRKALEIAGEEPEGWNRLEQDEREIFIKQAVEDLGLEGISE